MLHCVYCWERASSTRETNESGVLFLVHGSQFTVRHSRFGCHSGNVSYFSGEPCDHATVTLSRITSSFGTSSCPPELPVATFLIWSTTSIPPVPFPYTHYPHPSPLAAFKF